jgi:basic amino acid/polyamine antiporter, APA family
MTSTPQLKRAIGRWSLAALAVNTMLGSAVFGLPSVLAGAVGNASPITVLLGGLAMVVIVSCYAEVASQFTGSGGSYLYVRYTFGRLAGIQVGWLNLLTRFSAYGAAVNLFVLYLGEFFPNVAQPLSRFAVITLLVGSLTIVNYRGVTGGTVVSNAAAIAKLMPLILLSIVGIGFLIAHPPHPLAGPRADASGWFKALLLLFFSYGGYETSLISSGEAKDPRGDAPFALFVALGVVAFLYTVLQLTVVSVLPDPAHSERPLADVARTLLGEPGAVLVAVGALISVFGFLSAYLLTASRSIYSLAEWGDFPAGLATIHPRFRTPHLSIALFGLLIWGFSLLGSFSWNATVSAVGRLGYYVAVCAAVPILRRRQPEAARFRLWGGMSLPILGVLICLALLTHVDYSKSLILAATVVVGLLNWLWVRLLSDRHHERVDPGGKG